MTISDTRVRKTDSFGLRGVARRQGTTATVQLEGECDLATKQSMRDAFSRALKWRPECLVLDLSQLRFIDSTGIHIVVDLAERSQRQHCRLVIIPGPRQVQRVFEIAGLTEALTFIPGP
jgi:anti-sigma B factor antagonist